MVNVNVSMNEMKRNGYYLEEKGDILAIRSSYGKKILEVIDRGDDRKYILMEDCELFCSGKIEIDFLGPICYDHIFGNKICMVDGTYIHINVPKNKINLSIADDIFSTRMIYLNK